MSDLKKKYDEVKEQREKIIEKLKPLEENEAVKKYFELRKKNENLYEKQLNLYQEIKKEEYKCCQHVLVYSEIEHDRYEGRTYRNCGCIKCGLDDRVLSLKLNGYFLSFSQKIMYDYLSKNYLRGRETKIVCDLDLARAIYTRIKETHPDIDDNMAIKYFEIALNNIRNIKVSEERKINRAKRLSLDPKFKSWNCSDVHHD